MNELTTESLARFVGGEAEIQSRNENYLYRGEIATITVNGETLTITFTWQAKNCGGVPPHTTQEWENQEDLNYEITLSLFAQSDLGEGRLGLYSPIMGETVSLFPNDGSKMNPANILGFPEHLRQAQADKFERWSNSR